MKIVAICQFYNELTTGFLQQFCKYNLNLFDEVIAYDDGSTDGTYSYCKNHGMHLIRSSDNNFKNEVLHKNRLIEAADYYDADFIVSLDADEILSISRSELEIICNELLKINLDGFESNFINLWRSNSFKRTDSLFDDFKPVKLWKHMAGVKAFSNIEEGLHQRLYPDYVKNIGYNDSLIVLHTGFCTISSILDKFVRYRNKGQKGFELLRFVDESKLATEMVNPSYLPLDWVPDSIKPDPLTVNQYFQSIEAARTRVLKPNITIFSLIYKDIGWLSFMYSQLLKYTDLDGVEFYFIANDADEDVVDYMRQNYIPYYEYHSSDINKSDHYINNVYRAYNFGVSKAAGDLVVLLNSDMAFSEGWLESLRDVWCDGVCVSSRLIEQGKLSTGTYGIERNFGDSWENFDEHAFQTYASTIRNENVEPGGLYMPLMVRKHDFQLVGGYPEGNITLDSDLFKPTIAKPGSPVISGDTAFISKLATIGVKHVTSFNSVVYHFQEGEKRSQKSHCILSSTDKIAICNNRIGGINGEKVLWGHLLTLPNTLALDYDTVSGKTPTSFNQYVSKLGYKIKLALQNATFIPRLFPNVRTLMYLQDNLRAMQLVSAQQEINLREAECLVTNTIDTAASYPEYDFDICPVGVDTNLFVPLNRQILREKHDIAISGHVGIFIGALDEVKGWPEVLSIIDAEPDISWIVVTKYEDKFYHPRVKFFSKQNQNVLVELINCADFFILGSPVETQCLAAIEAALCDIPIVMKPVGIFSSFSDEERRAVGQININLHMGVKQIISNLTSFSPRATLLSKGISIEATNEKWWNLFALESLKSLNAQFRGMQIIKKEPPVFLSIVYKLEVIYRFKLLKPLIGRDTFYSVAEISVMIKKNMPMPVHSFLRFIWRKL